MLLVVILGAAVVAHQPLTRLTLSILRFPLVVVHSAVETLTTLPRLPELARQQHTLRRDLAARELELAGLREAVRHLTRSTQLTHAFPGAVGPVASIIGRSVLPTQHTIILDKGSRDGVAPNTVVVDMAGVVGRVVEASSTTSVAFLVTDPNSRIAALIERSREFGLAVGSGGRWCELHYLDEEADVMVNDRVVTAGLGGAFPKGLLIGTVAKLDRDRERGRLAVWVRPAVVVSRLEEVLCLAPSSSE